MKVPSRATARPNLLYLTHRVPYPPDKGDRIRTYHVLRFLSERANVHLACLADEPIREEVRVALSRCAARVAVVPVGGWSRWGGAVCSLLLGGTATEGAFCSAPLREQVRAWCTDTTFHATLSSSSALARYQRLPELRDTPAIVDLIDVDSQKWLDYAGASRGPRAWLYGLEGRRLRRLERRLAGWAEGLTVVTEAEADLFRQFAPDAPIHAVGNGVDLDYFQPSDAVEEAACVFVGALDYRPNVDAACWFCANVWPALHRARPDARFLLVGRKPVPAIRALAALPGVELIGQVPDVRPYLVRAAIAVVPLLIARGVQNKVLEALAMGKAVVASPTTLAGLRRESTPGALTASTPDEWVRNILSLLDDPERRRRLGLEGRRYVVDRHDWNHCLEPLVDLLQLSEPTPTIAVAPALTAAPRGRSLS
jgi:sugar transferase (PEP-CTERM/EpsH1 system associated)